MAARRTLIALAAFALTLPMSWSSQGHEIMEADWCSLTNQEIQIVETFNFDKKNIGPLLREVQTHGVVDRYMTVSNNIAMHCHGRVQSLLGGGYDSRAIVTGPANYLDPDHHQDYVPENEGLVGGCAICVQTAPPPPPANSGGRPRPSISADEVSTP
jgi:hypothetical protein